MRSRSHPPLVGQHGQKALDLLLPHVSRMPQTVPFHKHAYPLHIGLFSVQAGYSICNECAQGPDPATVWRAAQEGLRVS